jgi:hypothetical protein
MPPPLYTYNGQLLVKNGKLADNQNCCCNVSPPLPCCGPQNSILVDFGPTSTGSSGYPYTQTSVPFSQFRSIQTLNGFACLLTWSTNDGLTITMTSVDGVITTIVMQDQRVGGHGTTWTHNNTGIIKCLSCVNDVVTGTFDNWSINPWSGRANSNSHEGAYGKIRGPVTLPVSNTPPTPVNIGQYLACVGYRFKIYGYHYAGRQRGGLPLASDAEYMQTSYGQAAPWSSPSTPNGLPGAIAPNNTLTASEIVVKNWGPPAYDHLYRAEYQPTQNTTLWAWIHDSPNAYADNAPIEPYQLSTWQRFPRIVV